MRNVLLLNINRRHLGAICLLVTVIIFVSGLWPRVFHTENQAFLRPDGKGISFSGRGIAYSSAPALNHPRPDGAKAGSLTIEMGLQSDKEWNSSVPIILAIDDGQPCERLLLGQWKNSLIIRSRRHACFQSDTYSEIGLREALPKGKEQFLAITSGPQGTVIYLNGAEAKRYPSYSILKPDEILSGYIVLGNSSNGKHPWVGTISSLAMHDDVLSFEDAKLDFSRTRDALISIVQYRFDEKTGPIIRDHSGQTNDVIIPSAFSPLRRNVLSLPWGDFQATPAYVRDVALNILGFIPFGFYISWYLLARGVAGPRIPVIVFLLGTGTSLLIELTQSYLPERSSQFTDVLTNSFGTAIGIYLWNRYICPNWPFDLNA